MGSALKLRLSLIVLFVLSLAGASSTAEELKQNPIEPGGGWHEAVISVSDLDETAKFFTDVAGWRVVDSGALGLSERRYFGIEADTVSAAYMVIRPIDHPRGWVRLIEIDNPDAKMIRPYAQAWDTGGVFSIMTRSADIVRNLRDAEAIGWSAYNLPYDFSFGDLQLRNIVLRGPDGVNVAIYEWVTPKRSDVAPGVLSKAFNAMHMVADLDAAKAFYVDALGFEVLQEGAFTDPEERPTNFALPVNYATEIARNYAILIPAGASAENGRVELMQFEGFEGRDLSGNADFRNKGVLSLRFPVADIHAAYEAYVVKNTLRPVRPVAEIEMPPFGRAKAFTVSSPDGAFVTFFEIITN